MRDIEGDTGAKVLLENNADQVVEIELGSEAILIDVDTPEALERTRSRQ